jgi:hypothetical protein
MADREYVRVTDTLGVTALPQPSGRHYGRKSTENCHRQVEKRNCHEAKRNPTTRIQALVLAVCRDQCHGGRDSRKKPSEGLEQHNGTAVRHEEDAGFGDNTERVGCWRRDQTMVVEPLQDLGATRYAHSLRMPPRHRESQSSSTGDERDRSKLHVRPNIRGDWRGPTAGACPCRTAFQASASRPISTNSVSARESTDTHS